jgi:CheY-like chemotaxis protein
MPVTKPELVKGLKVLIVEDTPANQQVALFMLNRLGCDVDISDNGLLALQAVEKCSYDFIFMDCQMPVMDGYEATMELRKREGSKKHTTVIALTAHALSGDKEKCLAAGMDDYLSKPIMQKDLIDIMEKWDKKNHENEADYVSAILKQTSSLITPHGLEIFERLDDLSQVLEAEDLIDIINQFIMDAPVLLEELKNGITAKDAQQVKKNSAYFKRKRCKYRCSPIGAALRGNRRTGEK